MLVDPWWILLELVVGGLGFVLFTYGRKQQRMPQLATGVLLMVYPFFITSTAGVLVVGVLLLAAMWYAIRLGW